jgi:hypothetical protein
MGGHQSFQFSVFSFQPETSGLGFKLWALGARLQAPVLRHLPPVSSRQSEASGLQLPAESGIESRRSGTRARWIPAFAGMTALPPAPGRVKSPESRVESRQVAPRRCPPLSALRFPLCCWGHPVGVFLTGDRVAAPFPGVSLRSTPGCLRAVPLGLRTPSEAERSRHAPSCRPPAERNALPSSQVTARRSVPTTCSSACRTKCAS